MPEPSTPRDARLTRRAFSRRAAVAAAGILVAGVAPAQETPVPSPTPAPEPSLVDPLVSQIFARCPGLSVGDRKELETQIKGVLDLQKTLRGLKVEDGTEPDFVFRSAKGTPDAR